LEIWANGMLLVQALANLVTNAITYSEEGSIVTIVVNVEETSVTFRVIDTGCGIPIEAQQRIFERFYRVDTARSRSQGGTGLGLSIVKHIVSVHEGTVAVESKPGEGSIFTITLPRSSHGMEKLKIRSDAFYWKNQEG
jgi:signal transduction histidine kinase